MGALQIYIDDDDDDDDDRVSFVAVGVRKASSKSPRVLPPLPSGDNNPDVSRVQAPQPSSSSESSIVSTSASTSTDDNRVPLSAAKKPSSVSKSSDAEMSRVICFLGYVVGGAHFERERVGRERRFHG